MLRKLLGSVVAVMLVVGAASAADNKADKKANRPAQGTVTKVDADMGTLVVSIKTKDGAQEKTLTVTSEFKLSAGKDQTFKLSDLKAGDTIAVVEKEGKLVELRKAGKKKDKQ